MMQYADRHQVLQTTKMRTSLKNDGSWIHSSVQEKEEQDKAQTDLGEETKPAEVKQKSYVLSTAKRFESLDDPVSPLPKPTTEGYSATESLSLMANGEVVLPQEDAQPGGSTEETTDDAKPQEPTEEHIQNGEAQPVNTVADTAEENKEGAADAPLDQSNAGEKESTAEVSADIHVQNEALTFSSTKENPEAAPPAEPAEQPVVTAESEGEHAETTADQSNGDPIQAKVSADAGVKDPVAETSEENKEGAADAPVEQSNAGDKESPAEVSADIPVQNEALTFSTKENPEAAPPAEPAEQPVVVAESEGKHAETTADQSNGDPSQAKVSADAGVKDPVAKTIEENKEGAADAPVELSNAGDKESTAEVSADIPVQNEALTISSTKENPEAASPAEPAEQPVVAAESEGDHADTTADQSNGDPNQGKVSADAGVEDPVAETSDVAATGEEKEPAEVPTDAFEVKPQEEPLVEAEPSNDAHLEDTTVESTAQAAEIPPEDAVEVIEAVAAVVVESSHSTIDGIHATPEEEAPLQNSVEPIPDILVESLTESLNLHPVSESLNQSAANTTVESEESNVEAAAPAEAGLKTGAEEVPKSEVQPVDDTAPEKAADPVQVELDITDAVEPVAASEGGALESVLPDGGIELTDALDVEPPTTEAAPEPEPVADPNQSHSEEAEPNQSVDTNTTDVVKSPREEQQAKYILKVTSDGKPVCSFCDLIIDGLIKLTFSEPLLTCHAECLKCGVCAKGLGELLRPMFLHDRLIQCDGCFFSSLEA